MCPSVHSLAVPARLAGIFLLLTLLAAGGCRPGRTVPRLPDAASVQALLEPAPGQEAPRSARGRATLRLRVGERDLPALGLSFTLREASEVGAVLRPGVLAPVLSLWAGADGWTLRLPREKAAFDQVHEIGASGLLRPGPEASPEAGCVPTGPAIGRICAWMLAPQALLEDLRDVVLRRDGEEWIVTGTPAGLGTPVVAVEVHLTAQGGAVVRWDLRSGDSSPLVHVEYSPPRGAGLGRTGQVIRFELAPLAAVGTLTHDFIRAQVPDARERPPVPAGWSCQAGTELGPALARLQENLADDP
jgi:hypothetical protein